MNQKITVVFILVLLSLCINNAIADHGGFHCPRKVDVGLSKVDKCQSDNQCTGTKNVCCCNQFGYHECATGIPSLN